MDEYQNGRFSTNLSRVQTLNSFSIYVSFFFLVYLLRDDAKTLITNYSVEIDGDRFLRPPPHSGDIARDAEMRMSIDGPFLVSILGAVKRTTITPQYPRIV